MAIAPRTSFPARPGLSFYEVADYVSQEERRALTHQPALAAIFHAIFGEEAKPLDYSWPRIAGPGRSQPAAFRLGVHAAWDAAAVHGVDSADGRAAFAWTADGSRGLASRQSAHPPLPPAWTPTSSATSTPRA